MRARYMLAIIATTVMALLVAFGLSSQPIEQSTERTPVTIDVSVSQGIGVSPSG